MYSSVSYATRGTEQIGDPSTLNLTDLDLQSLSSDSASRIRVVQFDTHALGFGQGEASEPRGIETARRRTRACSSCSCDSGRSTWPTPRAPSRLARRT